MRVYMKRPCFSVSETCGSRAGFKMTTVSIESDVDRHTRLMLLENCGSIVVAIWKGVTSRLCRAALLESMAIREQ